MPKYENIKPLKHQAQLQQTTFFFIYLFIYLFIFYYLFIYYNKTLDIYGIKTWRFDGEDLFV